MGKMPQINNRDDGSSSGSEIEEWISDWQFERVAPTAATTIKSIPQDSSTLTEEVIAAAATSDDKPPKKSNEGGVFFFERVLPGPATNTATFSAADPHRVSVSSTDSSTDTNKSADVDQ